MPADPSRRQGQCHLEAPGRGAEVRLPNLHVLMEMRARQRVPKFFHRNTSAAEWRVSRRVPLPKAKGDEAAVSWLPLVPLADKPGCGRDQIDRSDNRIKNEAGG